MFNIRHPRSILRGLLPLLVTLAILASTVAWPPVSSVGPAHAQVTANPIDDSTFFVRQHYRDFLNRDPDAAGLAFWINEIESCGGDTQCREVKRINVSAAFFLSIEFQETGYLVYRARKAAYGKVNGGPVPVTRQELLTDAEQIGHGIIVGVGDWQGQLETNKQAYFDLFVVRQRFTAQYPQTVTPGAFVDSMNANAGSILSPSERDALVGDLTAGVKTRAQVLRAIAENAELIRREFNRAFVLMQYIGYLRRNPDNAPDLNFGGWQFWFSKLEQFGGNFVQAEMVKAFLFSAEYRDRFGPAKEILYTNPTDPLLYRKRNANGEVISYYGVRDAGGFATTLKFIKEQAADGGVTIYTVDGAGRITEIEASNGVTFKLAWQSSTSLMLKVVIPGDDPVELTVPVTLNAQTASPGGSTFNEKAAQSSASTSTLAPATSAVSNVATARVARCNGADPADDAIVHLEVGGILGGDTLRMDSMGNGIYQAPVPISASNPITDLAGLRDSINTVIVPVCQFLDTVDLTQVAPVSAINLLLLRVFLGSAIRVALALTTIASAIATGFGPLAVAAICNDPIGVISDAVDRVNASTGISLLAKAELDGIQSNGTFVGGLPPGGPFSQILRVDFPQCVDRVEVSPTNLTVDVGKTSQLTATVEDAQSRILSLPLGRIVWTSSNSSVATVDAAGSVKGAAIGTTQITALEPISGKSGTVMVTVKAFVADVVKDFSIDSNPNGLYSYGYSETLGGPLNLHTFVTSSISGLNAWSRFGGFPATNSLPAAAKNTTGSTLSYFSTVRHPADVLNLHPGPNGEYSVLRFTAPSAGSYQIVGTFQGIDIVGTTTDVHVLSNSTPIFNGIISGLGTAPFSLTVSLTTGQRVDFAVGFGSNGNFFSDSTGLRATITRNQ